MKIHLITGGSGSGKSAWGESWIAGEAKGRPLIYIATMRPRGEEAQKAHPPAPAAAGRAGVPDGGMPGRPGEA